MKKKANNAAPGSVAITLMFHGESPGRAVPKQDRCA